MAHPARLLVSFFKIITGIKTAFFPTPAGSASDC